MLKILWNTQKTPTKHALRHLKNFFKIRFLAEKSGSQLRCRIMLKIPWNSQKTPTKHVLRLFEKFLKIWFSAQKSGSLLLMLNKAKNTMKHSETRQIWEIWKLRPPYSPETPNLGQNRWCLIVLYRVTLKFDEWPWKTIGHLSFAVSSFVQHFIAIGEFKLELQSGNAQFGSNSTIFRAVWPCNLMYDLEKQ